MTALTVTAVIVRAPNPDTSSERVVDTLPLPTTPGAPGPLPPRGPDDQGIPPLASAGAVSLAVVQPGAAAAPVAAAVTAPALTDPTVPVGIGRGDPTAPQPSQAAAAASEAGTAPPRASANIDATEPEATRDTLGVLVARGDSLYDIFRRSNLSQADMLGISRSRGARSLSRLQPGQRIDITVDGDRRVVALTHHRRSDVLIVERTDRGFRTRRADASQAPAPATTQTASVEPEPAAGTTRVALDTSVAPASPRTPATEPSAAPPDDAGFIRQAVTVANGDSLYMIFKRRGYRLGDLANLLASGDEAKALKRLRPGQNLEFFLDDSQSVARLVYHFDEARALELEKAGAGYEAALRETPLERRPAATRGVIESSLFLAGQEAGLSDRTIMALVEIFGWDVDFALDIRAGDRFSVLYEELYKDGERVREGAILAAEFVTRGRAIRAVRYVDPNGDAEYFSPDGKSMRKAFLRTPVNFTRISSRFSLGRRHPVLHKIRAHRGVDYAAPRGTPVRASGKGRVDSVGRKGGYGKTIVLKHGSTYTTLYAHLSRFARGIRRGSRVRQGQVIGYVGSTGLATGPHLHYEFRVRGVHKDPLRVRLPGAAPIDKRYAADFRERSAALLVQLDALSKTQLASRE